VLSSPRFPLPVSITARSGSLPEASNHGFIRTTEEIMETKKSMTTNRRLFPRSIFLPSVFHIRPTFRPTVGSIQRPGICTSPISPYSITSSSFLGSPTGYRLPASSQKESRWLQTSNPVYSPPFLQYARRTTSQKTNVKRKGERKRFLSGPSVRFYKLTGKILVQHAFHERLVP